MATRRVPSSLVLVAPVRTRYYFGRLLTAADFEREQDYHRGARFRMNLALLGAGVVMGLSVGASRDGSGVEVSRGIAIDGFGREIIVPCGQIVPLSGAAVPRRGPGRRRLVLLLAYREELTDPMPGLGGDESGAEASVIRESFQIWYEPVRRVPGGPSDPERDAAVVLATVKVSADGRVGARGIERGGRRGSGRSS